MDAMKAHTSAILTLLCGCGVFGGGGDDDDHPKDAGPTGLTLAWRSRPEYIPSDESSGKRITRAAFEVSNLRVVGDAGPLALGMRSLLWATDVEPESTLIADAPSGLYSRCLFDLVAPAGGYAYEIEGTVVQSNMTLPFVIHDRNTTAISVTFSEMLVAGGEARIRVEVGVDELVGVVDFTQVPLQNGKLVVEDGSTQLTRVRMQLASAFGADDDN